MKEKKSVKRKIAEILLLVMVALVSFIGSSAIANAGVVSTLTSLAGDGVRYLYLGNDQVYAIQSKGSIVYNEDVAFYASDIYNLTDLTNATWERVDDVWALVAQP